MNKSKLIVYYIAYNFFFILFIYLENVKIYVKTIKGFQKLTAFGSIMQIDIWHN